MIRQKSELEELLNEAKRLGVSRVKVANYYGYVMQRRPTRAYLQTKRYVERSR